MCVCVCVCVCVCACICIQFSDFNILYMTQGKTRHRVVTLSGQLIDSSGTMSGGGNRVLKGRMSSKASSDVSPLQVEEKKKRLEDNERALAVC